MSKSAALIYLDPTIYEITRGKQVECDYSTELCSDEWEVYMTFLSEFSMEVKKNTPVAIAFYLDDTLIACKPLEEFAAISGPLTVGDTVTVRPPKVKGKH